MKTIFDKVDPKYLECGSGTCDHLEHKLLPYLLVVFCLAIVYFFLQETKELQSSQSYMFCVYWCFCPNSGDTMTPLFV